MNFFKKNFGNKYKIEKIDSGNNCELSFCPSRGGIITSLVLQGREILYFDNKTFRDKNQNVRGGIPILFPNAGLIPEGEKNAKFKNLKRHGFARNSKRWQFTKNKFGFEESLTDDSDSRDVYPYLFNLTIRGEIEVDNRVTIYQEVENTSPDTEMPIAMGLHPYFKVRDMDKKNIIFNFKGGDEISQNFAVWSEGGTVYVDNPKCLDEKADLKIFIPGLGNLSLDVSAAYKKIWIWSEPGKDFICIEPMMREQFGIIDSAEIIKPNEKLSLSVKISLDF